MKRKKRLQGDYTSKYYIDYIFNRLNKKYGLTYPQISAILTEYHKLAREDYTKGETFYFKNQLGNLQLYKEKRDITVNEKGEIVNQLPVNWRKTWKLWKDKPELKDKQYIRYVNPHSDNYMFSTSYQLSKAKFKNKSVYEFVFNKGLKKELHENILEGKVDAYLKNY